MKQAEFASNAESGTRSILKTRSNDANVRRLRGIMFQDFFRICSRRNHGKRIGTASSAAAINSQFIWQDSAIRRVMALLSLVAFMPCMVNPLEICYWAFYVTEGWPTAVHAGKVQARCNTGIAGRFRCLLPENPACFKKFLREKSFGDIQPKCIWISDWDKLAH